MVAKLCNLLLIVNVLCICGNTADAFLNIEDLKNSYYNIEILKSPIYKENLNSKDGIRLSSKYGQAYYCNTSKALAEDKSVDLVPADHPIPLMLVSLSSPCLTTIKGWWTYEFCFNGRIKQYHSEDGVVMGEAISLGDFEADYDWKNKTNDDGVKHSVFKKKKKKLLSYHSQTYVNGTMCGLLDAQRNTEVRFYCDNSVIESYIERVDEPSTCSYLIIIKTPLICAHPYTKPASKTLKADITCQPIIPKPVAGVKKPALNWHWSNGGATDSKVSVKHESEKFSSLEMKLKFVKNLAMTVIQSFMKPENLVELSGKLLRKLLVIIMEKFLSTENLPTATVARSVQKDIELFYQQKKNYARNYFYDPVLLGNQGVKITLKQVDSMSGEVVDNGDQDRMLRSMEDDISRELEDAGIGSGTRLEVHLISNHDLTGNGMNKEESRQFREVLLEVLGGSQFEHKEKQRYKDLIDNYSMLYADKTREFSNMNKDINDDDTT
ncbi:uncharacterized protein LOC104266204 [Ciona intestinalis]